MGTSKKPRKRLTLSSGRPPNSQNPTSTLSSKSTRTTIRRYHTLSKRLAQARNAKDDAQISTLEAQISALGGLAAYQAASAQGQALDRGGDTSVELMRWLPPSLASAPPRGCGSSSASDSAPASPAAATSSKGDHPGLRLLEIGALSTTNACAGGGVFAEIVRIDLRARIPGILRQDFMERPLPDNDGERFDVVSLSLVLNFVPDARGRGEMLRRTAGFLRRGVDEGAEGRGEGEGGLLFLVLPAPCVVNSRYFDDDRLGRIMASVGYVLRQRKQTARLVYYLWQLAAKPMGEEVRKMLVRDGKGMNNFHVELRN